MLLYIGYDTHGNEITEEMHKGCLRAIYRLIRQPIADKLGEQSDWVLLSDLSIDAFSTLELDELPADEFNLAYQLIMSNPDNDERIGQLTHLLEPLFKADPRFQAA